MRVFQTGVGSVMIVAMQPDRTCIHPRLLWLIVVGIIPLDRERAVEPLDLPVRLWPIRTRVLVRCCREGGIEQLRLKQFPLSVITLETVIPWTV